MLGEGFDEKRLDGRVRGPDSGSGRTWSRAGECLARKHRWSQRFRERFWWSEWLRCSTESSGAGFQREFCAGETPEHLREEIPALLDNGRCCCCTTGFRRCLSHAWDTLFPGTGGSAATCLPS